MVINRIYPHHEISRIMTAAIVNSRFRDDLLANPLETIESGYGDEVFLLDPEQSEKLASIHAGSIEEFATMIVYA